MTTIQGVEYIAKKDEKNGYYYGEGRIPLKTLFGDESLKSREIPFNVGIIDNDLDAFIYLHSWTYDRDPKYWGILNIKP
jgi:hypothetical protein